MNHFLKFWRFQDSAAADEVRSTAVIIRQIQYPGYGEDWLELWTEQYA